MTPSEYFQRNFWVGASFLRPSEAPLRYEVGVDRIMWGADYPHSEGSYPYTTEALRAAFADVPPSPTRRAMVETTAAAFYGFDLDRLRPLGDRIGPTVAEVAGRSPRPTIRPTPPATRSTPSRSSRPGDGTPSERGSRRMTRSATAPATGAAAQPRGRGHEGATSGRRGHRRVGDRPRGDRRRAAAAARTGRAARAHPIATVDMPGLPVFGAGWFGVQARHGDRLGEYPLFMPMTTEQATVGGRETFGEPKKIGAVEVDRDGDQVTARIERMGFTLGEVAARSARPVDIYAMDKTDFYFKCSPRPTARASTRTRSSSTARRPSAPALHEGIDGELILNESPLDPIADIVVRRIVDQLDARCHDPGRRGRRAVPRADLLPFVHQRYDDLSVLGGEAMSDRYTIISADAHAGLPCEEYRPVPRRRLPRRSSTSSSPSATRTATSR